ncbi:hypothetical protein [Flavobacterium cheonanense]|jgi:hypothetical protein
MKYYIVIILALVVLFLLTTYLEGLGFFIFIGLIIGYIFYHTKD